MRAHSRAGRNPLAVLMLSPVFWRGECMSWRCRRGGEQLCGVPEGLHGPAGALPERPGGQRRLPKAAVPQAPAAPPGMPGLHLADRLRSPLIFWPKEGRPLLGRPQPWHCVMHAWQLSAHARAQGACMCRWRRACRTLGPSRPLAQKLRDRRQRRSTMGWSASSPLPPQR